VKGLAAFKTLLQQRTWDKEVLLWFGPEKPLLDALGTTTYVELDLLDLFQPESLPIDEAATTDELRDSLRERLRTIPKGPQNRTVLIVTSIGLLARYEAGLSEFYNWFVGSYAIVVLLMENEPDKSDWPDEVRCEAKRLVRYFTEPGMVKDVYHTKG
jgi:hypothetical protein